MAHRSNIVGGIKYFGNSRPINTTVVNIGTSIRLAERSECPILRTIIDAMDEQRAANRAVKWPTSSWEKPGRKIIKTPRKPTVTANILRNLIISPKKTTARTVINRGVINSKEYASANSKTVKLKKAQLNPITCRIDLIPIKIVLLGRKLPDFLSNQSYQFMQLFSVAERSF